MRNQRVTLGLPTEFEPPVVAYLRRLQAIPANETENAAPSANGSGANSNEKPSKFPKTEYKKPSNRSIDDLLGDVSEIKTRASTQNDAARVEARRLDFLHNGYRLIPATGKRPSLSAWQTSVADEMDVRRWTRSHSKATNTGIVLGENLVAIDVRKISTPYS